jgi:hypothetical protein
LDKWKVQAQTKNPQLFDDKLWEMIIQLMIIDSEKRIGIKEARISFKATFPKELLELNNEYTDTK